MAEFKYEIVKELGVISESAKGWTKELNLVSWNDKPPKYDIRDWAPDHEKMGKGVSLTEEEMESLIGLFNARDEEDSFE
ncbi:MAG: YdbC family protein [Ruminiclostridium sp.]